MSDKGEAEKVARAALAQLDDAFKAVARARAEAFEEAAKIAENWMGSNDLVRVSSRPGGDAAVKLVRAEAMAVAAAIRARAQGGGNG